MFKRNFLQFLALLSLLALGTMAIHVSGAFVPGTSQVRWGILEVVPAEAAGTIYVDASAGGSGTGTSWLNAFTKLQDALAAAANGDQIWVAAGVYYPDEGGGMTNNDRAATFTMMNGVEVYGGFAGTETGLGERDWVANVTVLSGDIEQNDTTDPNGVVTDVADIAGNNAYHVVTGGGMGGSAVLDGFTVTAGQANGSVPDAFGGGMYNDNSSPTLTHVTFSGNGAQDLGGGMFNATGSSPTLTHVTFSDNQAVNTGGGMFNDNSSPVLTSMIFSGNQVTYGGGGMGNSNSSPALTNVSFTGNQAGYNGGGMFNETGSSPTLTNVSFTGNQASNNGGGMYNDSGSPTLTNVSFSGNYAAYGGGMLNETSNPALTNTILWNNQAGSSGHQIFNSSSTPVITYSDIQGSGGSGSGWDSSLGTDGGGNLDADPLFVTPVDPATAPTTAGDLHMQTGSPAVDAGKNGDCPATDLDGVLRPIDGDLDGVAVCDMGAYEKLIDLFLPLIMR